MRSNWNSRAGLAGLGLLAAALGEPQLTTGQSIGDVPAGMCFEEDDRGARPPAEVFPPDRDVSLQTGLTAKQAAALRAAAESAARPGMETGAIGGAFGHADGQPAGALSGVVVFAAAGHGWTADTSSNAWVLQRPLLLDMNEDHGNLDQLNYFVNYLYNAGATVVPFRPVGYQPIEIVLDNDDPGVSYTGTWTDEEAGAVYYENGATASGVHFRWAWTSAEETATARYTPDISQADFYPVYCWTPDDVDRVEQTYRIVHSGGTAAVTVDHARVGSGWVWLGTYHFEAGTAGYVEITNASPMTGVVVADAIRFGNGIGDIVRPGPNTVSGFLREEECSRYWAESEAGNNAVGLPSSIWDLAAPDSSDNVGTAARWARVMNRENVNTDRWRRVYMEFHSNATADGLARGELCLISTDPTANQTDYATIVGEKVEADMLAVDDDFEYPWAARSVNTFTGAYGAISASNNGDEFDATLIEVAFHDNVQDAALLLNAKVRDALARSTVQGMIMFLNGLPGSQVPLAFAPGRPELVRAVHDGQGGVVLSWEAPEPGPANGDPPTGYRVYRSTNGRGFGEALTLGDVLEVTLDDVPAETTTFFRVAAFNDGGESMPSAALGVRRPAVGRPAVLVVDGFDRVSRFQNTFQTIPLGQMQRPITRRGNSFGFVVQHGQAVADAGLTFDSCTNEAVVDGRARLTNYGRADWIAGEEAAESVALSTEEQAVLSEYLLAGGNLFISGSELAEELDLPGQGDSFYETLLGGDFLSNNPNVFGVIAMGGIMSGLTDFDFNPTLGAAYRVDAPDVLEVRPGSEPNLKYTGRGTKIAGYQRADGPYRAVVLGFPFEAVSSEVVRADIMQRIMAWLAPRPGVADLDGDGDGDQRDFAEIQRCWTSSSVLPARLACYAADLDGDADVDPDDLDLFIGCASGPDVPIPAPCP